MNILFLSRKRSQDIGGLSRFILELTRYFPDTDWRRHIDCIHTTDATLMLLGVFLKLLFRAPLTVTAHGKDITWPNAIYQKIFFLCSPFVNAWVVDSEAAATLLKRKGAKNIHIIAPGISVNHIKQHTPLARPAFDGKTILTTVGNLVLRKGHVWFIRHVLTKLPSRFIYIIVGAGKEAKRIHEASVQKRVHQRVFCLGQLDNGYLAWLFTRAHIYVAPNQHVPGDFEGFGIAAGEAAAMGLPVLASRIDGLPAVIHHNKNGLLVQTTPNAWARAILSMESPNARTALGAKARRYTRVHFSWKKTVREYSDLFREAAGKRKLSPKRFFPT